MFSVIRLSIQCKRIENKIKERIFVEFDNYGLKYADTMLNEYFINCLWSEMQRNAKLHYQKFTLLRNNIIDFILK